MIENQYQRLMQVVREKFVFGTEQGTITKLPTPKAKHYRQFLKKLKDAKQK